MGTVRREITIVGSRDRATTTGTIDTGAVISVLPESIAARIGISNRRMVRRKLADGRVVTVPGGTVRDIILLGRSVRETVGIPITIPVTVMGDQVLIGVQVLEYLNMSVNPTSGTIEEHGPILRASRVSNPISSTERSRISERAWRRRKAKRGGQRCA